MSRVPIKPKTAEQEKREEEEKHRKDERQRRQHKTETEENEGIGFSMLCSNDHYLLGHFWTDSSRAAETENYRQVRSGRLACL